MDVFPGSPSSWSVGELTSGSRDVVNNGGFWPNIAATGVPVKVNVAKMTINTLRGIMMF